MNATNTPPLTTKDPMKATTSSFQLQTKIRVIIQQVLSATVRKLSHFGQKMDKFEQYFITFKERFEAVERQRNKQQQQMKKIQETQLIIRRDLNMNEIRYNEDRQRNIMALKQQKDDHADTEKIVKTLLRQNQNINIELGKTKTRFLEYSNIISNVKEEVSWKITKYLQETSQNQTQMKVNAQAMKNEYFNINLLVKKQKQKYDQIIIKHEQDENFKQQIIKKMRQQQQQLLNKKLQMQRMNTKIDDLQFAILSKIKTADAKFDSKMTQLQKNNSKLTNIFKKMDNFSSIIENIKTDIQEKNNNLIKNIEQANKKMNEIINDEIIKINKQNLKLQKSFQKKINAYDGKLQKLQDFLLQKLQFLKMQIQNELSNKTNKLIQQKTKNEQNINSSTMEEINSKLHKMQIQTNKHSNKLQTKLHQSITQMKKQVDKIQDTMDDKIQKYSHMAVQKKKPQHVEVNTGISNQKIKEIFEEIQAIKQNILQLKQQDDKILKDMQYNQKNALQFKKKQDDHFVLIQQRITNKIQKAMFLVTKMRGDLIIRNQFNDKEIKQLRKSTSEYKENIQSIWKIVPGISQCINLILSLIFDAEFQHSKIIQDNLPLLVKDSQKFTTICQGVLYEYKEKKKPGNIMYRHSDQKKIDLVKATFFGFIQVWQELFAGFLKNKQHLLPKGFYKKIVEKNLKYGGKYQNEKQSNQHQMSSSQNIQNISNQRISSTSQNNRTVSASSQTLNNSFYIRKPVKKSSIRDKQTPQRSHNQQMVDIKE